MIVTTLVDQRVALVNHSCASTLAFDQKHNLIPPRHCGIPVYISSEILVNEAYLEVFACWVYSVVGVV